MKLPDCIRDNIGVIIQTFKRKICCQLRGWQGTIKILWEKGARTTSHYLHYHSMGTKCPWEAPRNWVQDCDKVTLDSLLEDAVETLLNTPRSLKFLAISSDQQLTRSIVPQGGGCLKLTGKVEDNSNGRFKASCTGHQVLHVPRWCSIPTPVLYEPESFQ